jgi:hypothetical protein
MRNHFLRAAANQSSGTAAGGSISGKYHWYGTNTQTDGGFGAFWDTGSSIESLQIVTDGGNGPDFYERNDDPTHTSLDDEWNGFTIDLSDKSTIGRLVLYARKSLSSDFRVDVAFDDIILHPANGNTAINFDTGVYNSSNITNNAWQRSPAGDMYTSATGYSTAKSYYDRDELENIGTTYTGNSWLYGAYEASEDHPNGSANDADTTSTNTGPDMAADNATSPYTTYLHFESSGNTGNSYGTGYCAWKLRRNKISGVSVAN